MEKQNKTGDIKAYMREYRQSKNKLCESCGGKFNNYTQEKHEQTLKHLKQTSKKANPSPAELNEDTAAVVIYDRQKPTENIVLIIKA